MSERATGPRTPYASGLVLLAVGVVVAAVLAVGTWSATSGPDRVFEGDGSGSRAHATAPPPAVPTTTPMEEPTKPGPVPEHSHVPDLLALVLKVLVRGGLALLVLLAVAFLLRTWWRERPRYRTRRASLEGVDLITVDPVTRAVEAMTADAERQAAILADGTPRNGIVACWQRFEEQAGTAGVPRHDWETSTEFTVRLLGLVAADPEAVTRLGALFRLARFSEHDVTEVDRDAALDALTAIHAGLTRRAGTTT